jgi:hypothetical protein
MTIPYSRPPAVKIPGSTAPKAPKPPQQMSWGRSLFGQQPKPAPQQTHSIYDQFTLPDPYKPGTLQQTATTGYNADVANAQKLAAMGTTPDAQIGADYAQRGQNVQNIYQGLAQQLAGIQTAQVAQGNAGAAALGAQTAGLGAPAGVQAVLGANTAATGNYGGSLQAAALSAGAQNQKGVLDAGTLAQQSNDQSIQKTLASLLSGVDPVSKRVDTMRGANQQVDASNLQTKLGLFQSDETTKTAAIAAGDKAAYDAAVLKEKRDEAGLSNATRLQLGLDSDRTKIATTSTTQAGATARAKTAAAARVKAAGLSAAAKKAAADEAAATSTSNNKRTNQTRRDTTGATAAGGKPVKSYKVTVLLPASSSVDPNTGKLTQTPAKRVVKTVPANVWTKFNSSGPQGKRKLAILGVPEGSKIQSSTGY